VTHVVSQVSDQFKIEVKASVLRVSSEGYRDPATGGVVKDVVSV
jgi:hypothetical protein